MMSEARQTVTSGGRTGSRASHSLSQREYIDTKAKLGVAGFDPTTVSITKEPRNMMTNRVPNDLSIPAEIMRNGVLINRSHAGTMDIQTRIAQMSPPTIVQKSHHGVSSEIIDNK
jgi:hypothetical protein